MLLKLSEMCKVKTGYPFRGQLNWNSNGEFEVIRMKDIDKDWYFLKAHELIRTNLSRVTNEYLLREGDLVIACKGKKNTAAIIEFKTRKVVAGPNLFVIKIINKNQLTSEFLAWYLNSAMGQKQISKNRAGSYIPLIKKRDLETLKIPIPPLAIQQNIVKIYKLQQRERELLDYLTLKRMNLTHSIIHEQLRHYE